MKQIFCPRCSGTNYISGSGKCWKCKDCGKYWIKHPKKNPRGGVKGCTPWNKGLTKQNHLSVAKYGKSGSKTKKRLVKEGKFNPQRNLPEPKIKISPEEMRTLYWDEGLTQYQIAEKLGVRQSAISLFMKRHNIPNRGRVEGARRLTKKSRLKKNRKISKALKGNTNWRYSHDYPNSDELTMIRFFARNKLPFEYVGDGSFLIDGKCPDFVWKGEKRIIEFFGDIWHRSTDEQSRVKFFQKRGWNCLVVWGREIRRSGWEQPLYNRISQWLLSVS